ncbi:MAG: phosphomannomutase [Nitrososphaerales archaeon]
MVYIVYRLSFVRVNLTILSISGFRGIVGYDLNPVELLNIGRSFGNFIRNGSCAIGRDTRNSGIMVSHAVMAGLLEANCDILDFGIVSTPALFREVARRNLEGGLMITASHNPPEWNGLKFIVKGGRGIFEDELSSLLSSNLTPLSSKIGSYSEASSIYSEELISYIGKDSCSGLKVSLDLGGGAGSLFAPKLFKEIGCKVLTLNDSPGIFSRAIDPIEDELKYLSESILANGFDVGFAYDCDADRVAIVDEKGRKLPADFTLMLCLNYLMKNRGLKDAVVSVDTSIGLEKMVNDLGGKVFYAKVGEANVIMEMMKRGCRVGGEGSSGGLILADFVLCRDGVLASALISKMIKQEGQLSDLIKDLPRYHQIRKKIPCNKDDAKRLLSILIQEHPNADTTDGIKFKREDSWILIRPSGTEEVLRLSVEAKSKDRAEEIMNKYLKRINSITRDDLGKSS